MCTSLETSHMRDLGVYGGMILKFITEKWGVMMWTGFKWLRIGTSDVLL
jgi:hypothetical protein